MHRTVTLLLATLVMVSITGCASVRSTATKSFYTVRGIHGRIVPRKVTISHKGDRRVIDDAYLKEIPFETISDPGTGLVVRYQPGLQKEAQVLQQVMGEDLAYLHTTLGLPLRTVRVHLLITSKYPSNLDVKITVPDGELPWVLFVAPGESTPDGFLEHNFSYPYLFAHELVETSLVVPTNGQPVLIDIGFQPLAINNHTRWFRDGLGDYAQILLRRKRIAEGHFPGDGSPGSILVWNTYPEAPIHSLAQVKDRIFTWNQFGKNTNEYYFAAAGVFLLLENAVGQEGVKKYIAAVQSHAKPVDGKALFKIAKEKLGVDLRELVTGNLGTDLGLNLTCGRISPAYAMVHGSGSRWGLLITVTPGGTAEACGLCSDDIITAINGKPAVDLFDLEMAILDRLESRTIALSVLRGKETKALTLKWAEQKKKSPPRNAKDTESQQPLPRSHKHSAHGRNFGDTMSASVEY